MSKITAAITGVQGYVPDYVLTNAELETIVETSDEWITTRTGIKERRILKGEGQGTSVIGIEACKGLLEKTGTDPKDIDLIICATVTPDMPFPATANIVADKIGATNSFSYDMSAACSGFLFALSTGAQFIEAGTYKKVIVIGADKMSSIINYKDRTTCIIFGDGGGAVLLEPNEEGNGIQDAILKTDGSGAEYLGMKGGGSRMPATLESVAADQHYAFQEGATVFKFAVTNMADVSAEIMERNNLTGEDISWLVPHQANKRIIDATANRMGIDDSKVMINIQKYGNTTAGTLPLCLWDYENQLKKGDNIILAAFGGGFTWGSLYLKWAYDPK
ncbi:ketoacyl-ACP synthase III [Gilvimarinus agarilyticus]|uniref:Beta-ketoacyl-[acyl-carrier-protein] synthase III n=1 Tax=Reichenbachiella agariperforans TaxID=156994 RepID=A0A1M6W0B2_REIAG|nr:MULTISPECIES: beta-ketoacyl-ACP synthase III [Reichenbachiella]MBU2885868.1 ketoacyl-ACP synthase III [Gilvimarinus agarilyticus]MBU2915251.1 ketoacyl-ACP synthase III [Reichenbachiella agariperforans]RJE70913.1 3-oxoacyl-ACP synthase [Reichenbachiella sp. MSK19-1]SHK87202.1 3-oxoacyl-[acyl-carrier-protein] synthase-3 [Reichenbachiella agariperforans]